MSVESIEIHFRNVMGKQPRIEYTTKNNSKSSEKFVTKMVEAIASVLKERPLTVDEFEPVPPKDPNKVYVTGDQFRMELKVTIDNLSRTEFRLEFH